MVKKEKKQKTISYRLQFNDTAIFMASSLSNFVNNLAKGINKIKWKYGHDDKQCDTCRIKDKDCELNIEKKQLNIENIEKKELNTIAVLIT